jgi:hypothetical protein
MKTIKAALIALAIAGSALVGLGVTADVASAYYPVGTVVTIGNTPAPGGSISCWQQVVNTTASILRCYKYDIPGNVTGTYEATLPTPYCNYVYWARTGGSALPPILGVANGFFQDYPGYPLFGVQGGSPGCQMGNPQTGSQGWRHIMVHTNGSESVGPLAGGSWVNNMIASRARDCYSPGDLSGFQGYIYPYSPCIETLITMQ